MRFPDGEIITTPKTIYWIGQPQDLGQETIIDVLKNDLLIIPCDAHLTSLHYLKKSAHKRSVFFFNLDHIIEENNIKQYHIEPFAEHLSEFLTTLTPAKSLVYSKSHKEFLQPVFSTYHIPFYKNPFGEKHALVDSIHKITDTLFMKYPDKEITIREAYRLFLLPLKYIIKVCTRAGKHEKPLYGYIKDLSLNGVGFILKNPDITGDIKMNSRLSLQLNLHKTIIQINSSYISRINPDEAEIGVRYDINDQEIIREDQGNILSVLMYKWFKQAVQQLSGE